MDSIEPLNPPTSAMVRGDLIPPSDRSVVEPRENPESHHQTLAGPARDVVEIGRPARVGQYDSTTPAARFTDNGRVLVGPCSGNAPPRSRAASPSAANSLWADSLPHPIIVIPEYSSGGGSDAPPSTLAPTVRGSKVRPKEIHHFYTSDSEAEQDASVMQRGRPLNRKAHQTSRAAPLPYAASGYNPGPSRSHGSDMPTKRAQDGVAGARLHDFDSAGAVGTHRSKRAKLEGLAEGGKADVEGQPCGQGTNPPPNSPADGPVPAPDFSLEEFLTELQSRLRGWPRV